MSNLSHIKVGDLTALIVFITAVYLVEHASCLVTPEQCKADPNLLYIFCCAIPPFFTRGVSKECGGGSERFYQGHNVTGLYRRSFDCSYWFCVLDAYRLIRPDGFLDHDKYFKHLDLWVILNPAFTDVMLDAKINCKQYLRLLFPLKPCEFPRLNKCIRQYIKIECPVGIPTKDCERQKKFYKACGKYFY
ncbi:uncharacterized protein LOC142976302 [Anticarsia gemmatalis]|uniref:uncharacterized protein LOC142976302 n=1 Tax=Anticarsia gemmatalis TaxID=129554 RepID=UPI003F771732